MKPADLRKMTDDELRHELDALRKQLYNLRARKVTDILENPHMVRQTRRDIARILTILRERSHPPPEKK